MSSFYMMMAELWFFFLFLFVFCCGICFSSFRVGAQRDLSFNYSYLILCACFCCVALEVNTPVYLMCYFFSKNIGSTMLSVFLLVLSILVYPVINTYNRKFGFFSFEYGFIFLVILFSSVTILHTYFLVLMYLLFELQNISLYILTAFNKANGNSTESGLKYFILSSFSSTIFLFGIALLYCSFGSLHLNELTSFLFVLDTFRYTAYKELGLLFMTLGLLFKLYCAPFHFWVPDIYHGSPTSTTVVLASISYISTFYVFINVAVAVGISSSWVLQNLISYFIVLCLLIGGIGGLYQVQLKRIVAYSSISSAGFMLYCVTEIETLSISDVVYFLCNYLCNILAIFMLLFFLEKRLYNNLNSEPSVLEHFSGLFTINKYISLLLGVLFFSISGIPPYTGFFLKYALLENSVSFSEASIFFCMLLNSACACYFYINVIKTIYYDSPIYLLNMKFCSSYWMCFLFGVFVTLQIGGLLFSLLPMHFVLLLDLTMHLGSSLTNSVIVAFFPFSF